MNGEIEGGVTYSSHGRGTVSEDADVSSLRDSSTLIDPHRVPGFTAPTASASQARRAPGVADFLRRYAILLVLAALIFFFQSREPAFFRIINLLRELQSMAVVALLGIGVTV